jgi:hypothetical protein
MYDPFNIAFGKTTFHQTVTADGRNFGFIRWGFVKGNDDEIKIVAFYVPVASIHFVYAAGKDPVLESNSVVQSSQVLGGSKFQAYEWLNTEFVSVSVDKQTWFRFV